MPWSGLEPLCLAAPPPQDGVSTNFTTRATTTASRQRRAADRTSTGPTGLEPATSRVTVECSNQTELRPQLTSRGRKPLPHYAFQTRTGCQSIRLPASHFPLPSSLFPLPSIAPRGIEPLSAP